MYIFMLSEHNRPLKNLTIHIYGMKKCEKFVARLTWKDYAYVSLKMISSLKITSDTQIAGICIASNNAAIYAVREVGRSISSS